MLASLIFHYWTGVRESGKLFASWIDSIRAECCRYSGYDKNN